MSTETEPLTDEVTAGNQDPAPADEETSGAPESMLSRLKRKKKRRFEDVAFEMDDGTTESVRVWQVTAKEKAKLESWMAESGIEDEEDAVAMLKQDPFGFYGELIYLSCRTVDGDRFISREEIDDLDELPDVVEECVKRAMRLNGFTRESKEESEKKSETPPSEDSPGNSLLS